MLSNPGQVGLLTERLLEDLEAFLPELILCGTILLMLGLRLFRTSGRRQLIGLAAVLVLGATILHGLIGKTPRFGGTPIFSGMLLIDGFGWYVRLFLLTFLTLFLWLSLVTGIPDREDAADYATLTIGGVLGMMLMASANHLLMAFIAVEMASLPSYVLAGFMKGKRRGSEAALKYVLYGACASGVMLYGISLLTGFFGTGSLSEIGSKLHGLDSTMNLPIAAGMLFVIAGLAFKLSAVPFHFWCPDVFEGAPAEVGAFLSIASKGAAFALTLRFLLLFAAPTSAGGQLTTTIMSLAWGCFAILTATFGNLAALQQTNLKRLFAYSTIAHAGLMMMPLTSFMPDAVGPILFYLSAYLLMNLGAFAGVALIRNATGSEEIDSLRGLIQRSPILAISMSVSVLSLLGLPPLAGFVAKFQVFNSLLTSGHALSQTEAEFGYLYIGLLVAAAINTAIGAGYYLKLLKRMILDEPPENAAPIRVSLGTRLLLSLISGAIVALGIFWGELQRAGDVAADSFRPTPTRPAATLQE